MSKTTKNESFLEKRAHSRVRVKIPVQYKPVDNHKELKKIKGHSALAKDLSLEGMYLKTDKPAKVGDIFRLDILMSDKKKRLFAFAEVARVTPAGAGIRLLLMPEEDREALRNYMDQAAAE